MMNMNYLLQKAIQVDDTKHHTVFVEHHIVHFRITVAYVLEIEQWNKIFGRWVNRGARGIAVFADENRSRQRLTHYFDISDTHESRYSRTVPIWDMRQEYEADVIETLESTFGEIENKSSLAEAIMGAARDVYKRQVCDHFCRHWLDNSICCFGRKSRCLYGRFPS